MGLCCIKMVLGNKVANNSSNASPAWCPVPCYPPVELQPLSWKLFFSSSSITEIISAWGCAVLLVPCSVSTCHGQPGLPAAGSCFALKCQAVQQGNNPGHPTVRRACLATLEPASWPGFQLRGRGVPCLPAYFCACKGCKFKEPCVPSSYKNGIKKSR